MKYECKENDCLIEIGKDKSEIFISVKGETAKTVIGLKDLNEALILFGVVKSLKEKNSGVIKYKHESYYVENGIYIHKKTGKEIIGRELEILKMLEKEGTF